MLRFIVYIVGIDFYPPRTIFIVATISGSLSGSPLHSSCVITVMPEIHFYFYSMDDVAERQI